MFQTYELGPLIGLPAPDFALNDHSNHLQQFPNMVGKRGILLGFIGDIWLPTSVRRIFWLQRHASKFAMLGTPVVLLVRDDAHTLHGFRLTSPLPVPFLLLSDSDGRVHRLFNMDRHPGLVLVDRQRVVQSKWLMPDERVWPRMQELVDMIETLPG